MQNIKREHHQRIATVLSALNGALLKENHCLFAGGTAIALRYGEYRESVDIDFLVSDLNCYRRLRQRVSAPGGIANLAPGRAVPWRQEREVRTDQYGIRTMLLVVGQPIKFEIVHEARMVLLAPGVDDQICGIATMTPLDMAASMLLANSDHWADDAVFSRDLIDLAMMEPSLSMLRSAISKAEAAYGKAIRTDLGKAIDRLQQQPERLDRCMQALAIELPKVIVWQKIRALRKGLS